MVIGKRERYQNRIELLQGTLDLLDPADAAVGAAARLRHRPGDPAGIERRAAGRHRIALPGAPSSRGAEVDRRDLEAVRRTTSGRGCTGSRRRGGGSSPSERSRWEQLVAMR